MSTSDIATKSSQHQVLNLIDNDLKRESEILKELIESVINTNNSVKRIYQSELEKNYSRLNVLSSEQKLSQKGMLQTEAKKQKKIVQSYTTSQTDIFDLNSTYRFKLYNLDNNLEHTNYLGDFIDDISGSNTKLLTSLISQFGNAQNKYLELKTIFINKNLNMQEQTYDKLVANMNSNKITFDKNIESYETNLEIKVKEFTESFDIDNLYSAYLDKNNELEATLNEVLTEYEINKSEYINKKNELLVSMKNELEAHTNHYKSELLNKYDALIQLEKEAYIDLNAQIKKIDIDIKYKQSQSDLNVSLIAQKEKLADALAKTIEEKIRHKVRKYTLNKEKQLIRKYDKINKVNLNSLRQFENKVIKKVSQIEAMYIDNVVDFNDIKVKTVFKIVSFMQDNYQKLYAIISDFKRYILNACELLTIQNIYIKRQHLAMENSQKKLEIAVNKQHDNIFMLNNDMNKLIDLHYKKQKRVLEYYLDAYANQKLKIYDNEFNNYDSEKKLTTAKIEKLRLIEKLKSSIIDNELLIENAMKEYDIDYSKANHLFKHEDSLNYVQEERINASVDVTKSMLKAMIQRQVNFADQQIKFAEAEYINRIEHIDVLNEQDIKYINQRIEDIENHYTKIISTLETDYAYRLDILEKRKIFFNKKRDIQLIEAEIQSEKDKLNNEIEKVNTELQENDLYLKYKNQLSQIILQVNNSKLDALKLKEKNISLFNQLKAESNERLLSFEQTVNIPTQLPLYDIETTKTAKSTLVTALEIAEKTLASKLEKPSSELAKLKQQINEIDLHIFNQLGIELTPNNETQTTDPQIELEKILKEFEVEEKQVKRMIESRYTKMEQLNAFELDYSDVNEKNAKYHLLSEVIKFRHDVKFFKEEDKQLMLLINKIGKSLNIAFNNMKVNKNVTKLYKSGKTDWKRFKTTQHNIWNKETLLR